MGRDGPQTPARRLRREGVRVSSSLWTLWGDRARRANGRLIVALGRAAGGAVARSRTRRIARDVIGRHCEMAEGMDLLLMTRGDVSQVPRRQARNALAELLRRLREAVGRREAGRKTNRG